MAAKHSFRALVRALWRRSIALLPARFRGVFFYPAGSFYSPLIDSSALAAGARRMPSDGAEMWEHIDLCGAEQRDLFARFVATPPVIALEPVPRAGQRYFTGNGMFEQGDALVLSAMLAAWKPKRVIEVGSGFSSAVMLDTADALSLATTFTFIEILPQRLRSLLSEADHQRVVIREEPVQSLDPAFFTQLEAGDMLFIDSSHVAKVGSDLAYLMLRVLPRLQRGVLVHFHDIFYPESYPASWIREGRAWNESLFLRVFLLHNRDFTVRAFNAFAAYTFPRKSFIG